MSKKITFRQKANTTVGKLEKEFKTFAEVRQWVAEDKTEGYGDVLAYGGTFTGLTGDQEKELQEMTYEDAIKITE